MVKVAAAPEPVETSPETTPSSSFKAMQGWMIQALVRHEFNNRIS